MGKQISLFSGYSLKENRTTNYCLLMLKMLYDENPKYLSEAISYITNENIGNMVGVKFSQQEKKAGSIPDGLIVQHSFSVYIETKNYDWFYNDQIEKHLEGLSQEISEFKVLLAIGKFESLENRFTDIEQLCQTKYQDSIFFRALTFEEFFSALCSVKHISKSLSDAIDEFNQYLNEEDLLPRWKQYLDVVNCAGIPDDVLKENVYMCPATGGAYNHWRCKYFGMYRNKTVEKIALIEAVIDVFSSTEADLKWHNVDRDKQQLLDLAIAKVAKLRPNEYPVRVMILGPLSSSDFKKDSTGGLMGNKVYFNVAKLDPVSPEDLAQKLKDKNWSEIKAMEELE